MAEARVQRNPLGSEPWYWESGSAGLPLTARPCPGSLLLGLLYGEQGQTHPENTHTCLHLAVLHGSGQGLRDFVEHCYL